ncbi:MAG: redoxin domain-containing protein [Chitinispirillaceae bacterium]|nr:redoxin domain-containing protein [Chitinispirillaceae bacterium]
MINQHNFQFTLLVDEGRKTAKSYGYGEGVFIKRTVYKVDPEGVTHADRLFSTGGDNRASNKAGAFLL